MSTLTIAWSMCASACLMLAATHLQLWFRARKAAVYLLSAVMALGAAANAGSELYLLKSQDVASYATGLRVENTAVFVLVVAMVWFVYLYFGTARRWLAVLISALWSIAQVANLASPYSVVFSNITELDRVTAFWGEQFAVAVGPTNPWKLVADIASMFILAYIVDASVRAWRRGDRQRATVVGGSMVLFIVLAGIHAPLVDAGLVRTPYLISFAFLAIVAAMTYELVNEALLASKYARTIEASERRWRSLLENVPLLVAGVDRSGRIDYANPYFVEVSGYPQDQLTGRELTDLLPEEDRRSVAGRFSQSMQGALPDRTETVLLTRQGGQRQIVWSNVLLTDEDGELAGMLSIGADVTEGRKAQLELRQTQRQMEQLTRANVLGELASALAHELNQPLTGILSNAQAGRRLLASPMPDLAEVRAIVDDIIDDDKRASEVIRRMRSMLRTGKVAKERFTIDAAIADVVELARGEVAAAGVQLRFSVQSALPLVEAGRVEVQQVVMNLLFNAVRAVKGNPEGKREIEIAARLETDAVLVVLRDNGPGIPAERLRKIFEPYFSTSALGMGMGLAISRRIVEAHGGKIWAENRASGGAEFCFTIPVPNAGSEQP